MNIWLSLWSSTSIHCTRPLSIHCDDFMWFTKPKSDFRVHMLNCTFPQYFCCCSLFGHLDLDLCVDSRAIERLVRVLLKKSCERRTTEWKQWTNRNMNITATCNYRLLYARIRRNFSTKKSKSTSLDLFFHNVDTTQRYIMNQSRSSMNESFHSLNTSSALWRIFVLMAGEYTNA